MSLAKKSLKRRSSPSSSRLIHTLFLLAATVLTVAACSNFPAYSHYEHIDSDSWRRDDTVTFTTTVRDSANYHLSLGLRATDAYPYTQLTVNVDVNVNDNGNGNGNENVGARQIPVIIDITDQKGILQGTGNNLRQYDAPITDIVLGSNDTLVVSISHAMSKFSLPGITDVGLSVVAR